MPNRFLKESICASEDIDNLSLFEEVFFYRLLVNCDDFGRIDARSRMLRSKLFPLKDNLSLDEIDGAVKSLAKSGLIIIYEVDGRKYVQVKSWEKHQQRRSNVSKFPDPVGWELVDNEYVKSADSNRERGESPEECAVSHIDASDNKGYQMISNDINCDQTISDDSKCHRYSLFDIRNSNNDNRQSLLSREEADDIIREQNKVIEAAENSGFDKTDAVRAKLISLYADNGMKKMLDAIDSCVVYGAPNIAYLQAVLKGEPKKKRSSATVPAQNYSQRDYSDETGLDGLAHMVAMMKSEEAVDA